MKVKKVCGNCTEMDYCNSFYDCAKKGYKNFKPTEAAKEKSNPELYNLIGWIHASVETHYKTLPKKFVKEMGEILDCAESVNREEI